MTSTAVRRTARRLSCVALLVPALALAACGDDASDTAAACEGLTAFRTTLDTMKQTLAGEPSARDMRRAGSAVDRAWDTAEDTLTDSQERRARSFERAVDDFEDSTEVVLNSSVAGALGPARTKLDAVISAEESLRSEIGCK